MKTLYVSDLKKANLGSEVSISGWLSAKRKNGHVVFFDIADSTGNIQAVAEKSSISDEHFKIAKTMTLESAITVTGVLFEENGQLEIKVNAIEVVGHADKLLSPQPRSDFNVFDPRYADYMLTNRHLFLRNPKIMAILRYRSQMMGAVHQWFRNSNFIEITAPILTPTCLYDGSTVLKTKVGDEEVNLTQCVAFYMEAAAHAFERVYNMGPSFRGEESRSKRHLMEYWHIKAELTFGNMEDIIELVESLISFITQDALQNCDQIMKDLGTSICTDGLKPPFPRITYRQAVEMLKEAGLPFEFGKSLGSTEEELLSKNFTTPFWICRIPRSIEPFPYTIDPDDPEVTMTADLIATNGYGELLGVAEKITDLDMLDERMKEKGKFGDPKYEWLRDMRRYGCAPHIGFGMGVERFIRWILNIPHVRDATPFPRIFRRKIHP